MSVFGVSRAGGYGLDAAGSHSAILLAAFLDRACTLWCEVVIIITIDLGAMLQVSFVSFFC